MKKILIFGALLLMLVGFGSCDDEMVIYDYTPICLKVTVQDKNGNNLLDSLNTNNILGKQMTITINGKTNEISLKTPQDLIPPSRAILPIWYGAFVMSGENYWWNSSIEPSICIGEFDGALNGKEEVELNIDGEKHVISFKNQVNKSNVKRSFYLDGKEVKDRGNFTIVI